MALNIIRGKLCRPQRVCLYAPEGIGKSTLASLLPTPLFLDFEDGADHLDVARLKPSTLPEAENMIESLVKDHQGFETLVVDTIDWLEESVIRQVIKSGASDSITSIEDFGWGKGYVMLTERMTHLLSRFDRLINSGMHVVLLGHAMVTRFDDPRSGGAYDRYELKMHKDRKGAKGTASLIKEWVDALLLGQFDDKVKETGEGKMTRHKAIATSGKERVLFCSHSAAWDAKNRHGLKDKEPWSVETLMKVLGNPALPAPVPAAAPARPYTGLVVTAVSNNLPAPVSAEGRAIVQKFIASGRTAPGKPVTPAAVAEQGTSEAPKTALPSAGLTPESQAPDKAPADSPGDTVVFVQPLPTSDDPLEGIEQAEEPDAELDRILGPHAAEVNLFLRDKAKVGPYQSYRSIDAKFRAQVLSNPASFISRVKSYAAERGAK
jgi:hypothetical protein